MTETAYFVHNAIASWVQAIGVVIAVAMFVLAIIHNRRQRALDRYEDLTTRWVAFLKTCSVNADLDIGPLPAELGKTEDVEKIRREQAAFLELLILCERTYILESVSYSPVKMESDMLRKILSVYAKREGFLRVFGQAKSLFDVRYTAFINEIIG